MGKSVERKKKKREDKSLELTIDLNRCYDENESYISFNTTIYLPWLLH